MKKCMSCSETSRGRGGEARAAVQKEMCIHSSGNHFPKSQGVRLVAIIQKKASSTIGVTWMPGETEDSLFG